MKIGLHNRMRYGMGTGILRLPNYWKKEKLMHEQALELLSIFDMQDLADDHGGFAALRRAAAAGDRPRTGYRAQVAAAGRACRGHEPLGNGGADGEHPARSATRFQIADHADRARHEAGHGHL